MMCQILAFRRNTSDLRVGLDQHMLNSFRHFPCHRSRLRNRVDSMMPTLREDVYSSEKLCCIKYLIYSDLSSWIFPIDYSSNDFKDFSRASR